MQLSAEQILATHKANVEAFFSLTNKAFASMEQLVELNLAASRTALAENSNHAQALLNVKDAQELLALQATLLQPLAEKTADYSRQLYDITAGTNAEFGKVIETKTKEAQQKLASLVDSASRNAPAGSDNAIAVLKGAVTAASNAFESMQKAVKQASDVAEANFNTVANSANLTKATTVTPKKR